MDHPPVSFFVAISLAYLAVCGVWLGCRRMLSAWPEEGLNETDRPWLDLAMIPLVVVGVLGVGELYRRGLLLPTFPGNGRHLSLAINLSLPYAPIGLALLVRRQSPQTLWLSTQAWVYKLAVGFGAALVGLLVYQVVRGDPGGVAETLRGSVSVAALAHFPAVFLEGVAIAFVFERLRWAVGGAWAIWVPCLLFAAAHVPRSLAAGRPPLEIIGWFAFNTLLPAMILLVIQRSRDVIWISIPHYVLDVAIGAFD